MTEQPPKEIWITLAGQIDQAMVQSVFQFAANATHNQIDTVHLLVQSGGGFVSDGICLYNFLKNLPINLITYNMGNVSSMAVILYLAAKHRVATENATFMIHKTHASPNPGATASMLKEIADSLDIDNARTEAILHENLTLPEEKWVLHQHGNLTFTAKEAMDFALVHELGNFAPPPGAPFYNITPTQ